MPSPSLCLFRLVLPITIIISTLIWYVKHLLTHLHPPPQFSLYVNSLFQFKSTSNSGSMENGRGVFPRVTSHGNFVMLFLCLRVCTVENWRYNQRSPGLNAPPTVSFYYKCPRSVTLSRTVQSVSGAAGQSSTHQHTPVAPHRHLIDTRVILEAKTQNLVLCSLYDGLISVTVIQRL